MLILDNIINKPQYSNARTILPKMEQNKQTNRGYFTGSETEQEREKLEQNPYRPIYLLGTHTKY